MIPPNPRVLVATASKHGATREIGAEIAAALERAGLAVTAVEAEETESLAGYDGVVIGSAVYGGRWLEGALRLVEEHAPELGDTPVWLFSSGPIGNPPVPSEGPEDAEETAQTVHAREHRVFGGRLDAKELGFFERLAARLVGAAEGDFRNHDDIRAFAAEIADELAPPARPSPG